MAANDNWFFTLKLISALGCGLIAGVFFAFSSFVMSALGRIQPAQGIAAMQSINIAVINPVFFAAFLGTAALCCVLGVVSISKWHTPGAPYVLAGCALYIIGTFLVTCVFNVPMNDALATLKPSSAHASALWTDYLSNWTMWNHVRTVAALAAAASITIGLCYRAPQPARQLPAVQVTQR